MAISATSATATPPNVLPAGQSTIQATLVDPDTTSTITIATETNRVTVQVVCHELEVNSVDPADVLPSGLAKPGKVVAIVDTGGTLTVGASPGQFTFTAN